MADEFTKAALYGIKTFNKKAKEKIGMMKLLELLNKHRVELAHGNLQKQLMRHYNGYVFGLGDLNSQNCVLLIISKKFGFIKWLVENDKIDLDTQAMQYAKSDLSKFFTEWKDKNGMSDDYAMLLMLLSIQDEPIRFLCEILK